MIGMFLWILWGGCLSNMLMVSKHGLPFFFAGLAVVVVVVAYVLFHMLSLCPTVCLMFTYVSDNI